MTYLIYIKFLVIFMELPFLACFTYTKLLKYGSKLRISQLYVDLKTAHDENLHQEMATIMTLQQEIKNNSTLTNEESKIGHFAFNFNAKHKQTINFPDPHYSHAYLSLPASEYSILNSSLVKRSTESLDTFVITLPLHDFSAALQAVMSAPRINALLHADVIVQPKPESCSVLMESGNIQFTKDMKSTNSYSTTHNTHNHQYKTNHKRDLDDEDDDVNERLQHVTNHQTSIHEEWLPKWLVWSDRKHKQSEHSVASGGDDVSVKSSIQVKFRISMHWEHPNTVLNKEKWLSKVKGVFKPIRNVFHKPESTSGTSSSTTTTYNMSGDTASSSSSSGGGSWNNHMKKEKLKIEMIGNKKVIDVMAVSDDLNTHSTTSAASTSNGNTDLNTSVNRNHPQHHNQNTTTAAVVTLPVTVNVEVYVEGNIPLSESDTPAWLKSPLRRLFPNIGKLATMTILKTLGPVLGDLLVKDYLTRKNTLKVTTDTQK